MTSQKKIKISPSILSADFANLESEIAQLDPALVDYLHMDVMDGHFVPNLTIGPPVISAIHKITNIPLDVHLMIEKPELHIEEYRKAGAAIITVHVEACVHIQRCLQHIRELGAKASVSLNPSTPLSSIENLLPDLDMILLMSVNPGFSGQKFIPQMMHKIKACREMIADFPIDLQVDGGIKLNNIRDVYDAGANVFVSGSEIFGNPPYNETIRRMKSLICLK